MWWDVAIWILTAVGSASIGALVFRQTSRAKPRVSIEDVSITRTANASFPDRVVAIPNDDPTIKGLLESDWTRSVREPSVPLPELSELLDDNKERVETHLQSLTRLESALPKLRKILDSGRTDSSAAKEFFELWEMNDGLIFGSLRGDYHRGLFEIPDPLSSYDGEAPLLLTQQQLPPSEDYKTGGDAVWVCGVRGGKFKSSLMPERPSDMPLNEYAAHTLAYFDRVELGKILDAVAVETNLRSLHEQLSAGIGSFAVSISRWSVSVVVANAGGEALSVAPKVTLTIDTADTAVSDGPSRLQLDHRDDDGQLAPVNVAPGQAESIRFVSPDLVSDFEKWRELYALYQSRGRNCHFTVSITPARWPLSGVVQSPDRPFGVRSYVMISRKGKIASLIRSGERATTA